MSTKKLLRTINESGKSGRHKSMKKYIHKSFRAEERAYLDDLRKEPDLADDIVVPFREQSHQCHRMNLSPAFRWLRSQTGRLWNEVHSEMCQLFSKDSNAYKTLIIRVEEVPDYTYGQYRCGTEDRTKSLCKNHFYVDDNGILLEKERIKRPSYSYYLHWNKYPHLIKWLDGRVISKVGDNYYWNIIVPGYHVISDTKWRAAISGNNLIYQFLGEESIYNKETHLYDKVPRWKEPFYFKYKYVNSRQSKGLSNIDIKYLGKIKKNHM